MCVCTYVHACICECVVCACVSVCVSVCLCVCVHVCVQATLIFSSSAGVGRTGTFIGLDVELQRASGEGVVDPYNFVLHMRDQRNLMVQTEVGAGGWVAIDVEVVTK